ncbi:hypothetical protein SB49_07880 [Sediminicola sp. YIK13]|nr:hypothetical protein SB49_07880 [Sediminicola sp. YIK13]
MGINSYRQSSGTFSRHEHIAAFSNFYDVLRVMTYILSDNFMGKKLLQLDILGGWDSFLILIFGSNRY